MVLRLGVVLSGAVSCSRGLTRVFKKAQYGDSVHLTSTFLPV